MKKNIKTGLERICCVFVNYIAGATNLDFINTILIIQLPYYTCFFINFIFH